MKRIDKAAAHAHCVSLAQYFIERSRDLGCIPAAVDEQSHIAVVETGRGEQLTLDLAASGVRAFILAGRHRVGFHYFNNRHDADRLLDVLKRTR